jgi:hypothetical protein
MKALLLIAVVGMLTQGVRPQAFFDKTATPQRLVATYTADDQIVRIAKTASPTLKVCMREVCKTVEEWLRQ